MIEQHRAFTVSPDYSGFLSQASIFGLVPLVAEVHADIETAISAYLKLGTPDESFLLESVQSGERLGRFSFIGIDPLAVMTVTGDTITINDSSGLFGKEGISVFPGNPIDTLNCLYTKINAAPGTGLPRFFGGAVGYVGYGIVNHIEKLPSIHTDDLGIPDASLMFPGVVLAFDHVSNTLKLITNVITVGKAPDRAYEEGLSKIKETFSKLSSDGRQNPIGLATPVIPSVKRSPEDRAISNMTKEHYESIVQKAKEYITAGDVFQVVLSRRLSVSTDQDAFTLYRKLRSTNPSPYMFLINMPEIKLIGSSPEVLARLEEGKAELRPIAGTRPRGTNRVDDAKLAAELLDDPKERAEHIMLVDLGRNDLGRVCSYGSVRIADMMSVERYSRVMHITTGIEGTLAPQMNQFDLLKAAFPAGTLTGAPKIRAMEIIDELEPTYRGPYGGIVGYFGWNGNMDTCITIRTIVLKNGKAHIQVGAGIINDSEPEKEFIETSNKAQALLDILGAEEAER